MKRLWLAILVTALIAFCLPNLGTARGEKARKRDDNDRKSDRPRGDRRQEARDEGAPPPPPATAPTAAPNEEPQGSGDRKRSMKNDRSNSDMARDAMERQKEIAGMLREGSGSRPPAPPAAEQLAAAQADLDTENYRHDGRLRDLRGDEQAASTAGNRKQLEGARRAIDQANREHAKRVADLQQKIQDLRARADGAAR